MQSVLKDVFKLFFTKGLEICSPMFKSVQFINALAGIYVERIKL